jgi:hypothetical protein
VLTLYLNGKQVPASLLTDSRYEFEVKATDYDPSFVRWSVLLGSSTVSSGTGNVIFNPTGNQLYTIHVFATNSVNGREEEGVFTINAVLAEAAQISVNWASLTYTPGEAIAARIRVVSGSGLPPRSLSWALYRNNIQIAAGTELSLEYQTSSAGIYRLRAVAVDMNGNNVVADSAVYVSGGFEIQASPVPTEIDPTCVYLGANYVSEVTGAGGPVTSLPYELASYSESVYLLPGTTHVSFDLDPNQNQVDDEVVVRTPVGNFVLKGYPTGLYDEDTGYDYLDGQPLVPAPADGVLRLTVEAVNVHGPVAGPFNFRVRVKCWRQGAPVYKYVKCPYSTFPGGEGKRDRHFAALFTEIEAQTDVLTDLNRLGSTETNLYTTPEVTTIPSMTLSSDGSPNPVQAPTGMFFTSSNWYAVYEPQSDTLPELDARAVAGTDNLRPFYLTLEQPATPPIIQRIKRLRGKLVVYMAQGALTAGSVINVRIVTNVPTDDNFEVSYSIPVTEDVYNDSTDTFQRVTAIPIDVSAFDFTTNGLFVYFSVDESRAPGTALPCSDPDPISAWAEIYSEFKSKAVVYNGGCYVDPVAQTTVDAESAWSGSGIQGCHEVICGPGGTYCYTNVRTGTDTGTFVQPLYFPAPFVSYGSNRFECYSNPKLLGETSGTIFQDSFAYQDNTLCGFGYGYNQCNSPSDVLIVVYPANTVAHEVIKYGSNCYSLVTGSISGSQANLYIDSFHIPLVSSGSILAVPTCMADECTGTVAGGSSVLYFDLQTEERRPVKFDHLDKGTPFTGVARQVVSSGFGGLQRGEKSVTFTHPRMGLFTAPATGPMDFNTGLFDLAKRIVVQRGSATLRFELAIGTVERRVDLIAGDIVFIDIGNQAGLLSDRTRHRRTIVTWKPIVFLPRVYDTATLGTTGTNRINHLGFAGMTNRSPYTFFDTVPVDVEQSLPNPDNIVTVQGATGPEYVLVRTRATGDAVPGLPGSGTWYAGQTFIGDMTFRFYTSREEQGAHGEMDVWLSSDQGNFPVYFEVDPFRTIGIQGGPLDVCFLMNLQTAAQSTSVRAAIANLHQGLLNAGISPKYGMMIIRLSPTSVAITLRNYENFIVNGQWNTSIISNSGDANCGLITTHAAGTLMNWTENSPRAFILMTGQSAYDYPPGYVANGSLQYFNKARQTLQNSGAPLFSVVNPNALVPVNPFTFVTPSNVPQSYTALAELSGGKNYDIANLTSNGSGMFSDIAMSVQRSSFSIRVESTHDDISRNSLRVADYGTSAHWPYVYTSREGRRIVAYEDTGTVAFDGTTFYKLEADPGISSNIVNASNIS